MGVQPRSAPTIRPCPEDALGVDPEDVGGVRKARAESMQPQDNHQDIFLVRSLHHATMESLTAVPLEQNELLLESFLQTRSRVVKVWASHSRCVPTFL